MSPLLKKLNFKSHPRILVLNAPDSFAAELAAMKSEAELLTDLSFDGEVSFALSFTVAQAQTEELATKLLPRLAEDAVCWFAYPKKSSKKYESDITRDTGWQALGDAGREPVRQVAIDEDWSALRFRAVRHISSLTRRPKMTLSKEGRRRTKENRTDEE